ncbi:PD-(D/E)XK nuclease family protein [Hymenobacter sp. 5516J-16]|uniref:PDDEXK-like family protein n=1 Tax=Hymenobacter sp. 5516J-16 TaxID=2932253 RepID=UPI001FD131AA|nr:PD-(D/E)XK nuclease family protein [Hymenobacter sp. 5516J-16]UOQ76547.1 PD-(D/E)XK nuclease family protein [Hymenobacter sp. 5516J-16]
MPALSPTQRLLRHAQKLCRDTYPLYLATEEDAYNIFEVLNIKEQEIKHSALLADLLDAEGYHRLGNLFLGCFLRQAGVPFDGAVTWHVTSEESHRYGRWDIALHGRIKDRPALVMIENKINAAEGDRQLDRYLEAAREHPNAYAPSDTWLIFLTPDGRGAQTCRRPHGACLLTWSYHEQVRTWLNTCLPHTQANPRLHQVLKQYLDLLTTYHNQHVQQTLSEKLAHYLIQHNMFAEAEAVQDALVQAKIELQLCFWEELEQQLQQAKLTVITDIDYRYSREKITDCYRRNRRVRDYGIPIELLRQERDEKQLVLWIELNRCLSFSVSFFQQGHIKSVSSFRRSKFAHTELEQFAAANDVEVIQDGNTLLELELTSCPIAFLPLDLPDMQLLADPESRQKLVKKITQEVKKLHRQFCSTLARA